MAQKIESEGKAAVPAVAVLSALNGSMGKALSDAQMACLKGGETLRGELARFAKDRMAGNAKALSDLAHCQSPADAVGLQQRWLIGLSRDYVEESLRLWKLAGEVAEASLKPAEEAARRARAELRETPPAAAN